MDGVLVIVDAFGRDWCVFGTVWLASVAVAGVVGVGSCEVWGCVLWRWEAVLGMGRM